MDNSTLAILISIFAILITGLGILIAALLHMQSNFLVMDANTISKKALEIATFSHKKEIAPDLVISYFIIKDKIYLRLHNMNYGKANILQVQISGHLKLISQAVDSEPFDYPIILLQNNYRQFICEPATFSFGDYDFIAAEAQKNRVSIEEEYKFKIGKFIKSAWFVVHYKNELDTHYMLVLQYKNDTSWFQGKPQELPQPVEFTK